MFMAPRSAGDGMQIREARLSDLPAIRAVHLATFGDEGVGVAALAGRDAAESMNKVSAGS